jgi:hypothetical protein
MNGLSDSVTIGIVLALVFGALFFYIYSRVTQNEKRVSLIENMLIDLKMTLEGGWSHGMAHLQEENGEETLEANVINHVEPVSPPEPLNKDDVDEEDIYKEVLAQSSPVEEEEEPEVKTVMLGSPKSSSVQVTKVQPNYESMSTKELKSLVKSRSLVVPSAAGKKELIATLRKADSSSVSPTTIEGGTFVPANEGATLEEVTE